MTIPESFKTDIKTYVEKASKSSAKIKL